MAGGESGAGPACPRARLQRKNHTCYTKTSSSDPVRGPGSPQRLSGFTTMWEKPSREKLAPFRAGAGWIRASPTNTRRYRSPDPDQGTVPVFPGLSTFGLWTPHIPRTTQSWQTAPAQPLRCQRHWVAHSYTTKGSTVGPQGSRRPRFESLPSHPRTDQPPSPSSTLLRSGHPSCRHFWVPELRHGRPSMVPGTPWAVISGSLM